MTNDDNYKYQHIKKLLLEDITNKDIGSKLTGRNELATKYNTARITIERAISELIGEGYLTSKRGSGTFVSNKVNELSELKDYMQSDFTYKSKTFALLISNITHDIYPYILKGVEDITSQHGIDLIVCNTDNSISKQEKSIKKLIKSGITGLVIVPAINGVFNPECFYDMKAANIPFVSCYRNLQGMYAPGIYCNSFQSGYIATEHLIKHNCKKIAYISAPLYATSFDRYQGYLLAHENYKLKLDKNLIFFDTYFDSSEMGAVVSNKLFENCPDVDGIFAFNDRIAAGIYKTMKERGLVPGKDIKIVSCDDSSLCHTLPVKLTSAKFPVYEVGKRATNLLLSLLDGNQTDDILKEVLNAELMVRESCGCINKENII